MGSTKAKAILQPAHKEGLSLRTQRTQETSLLLALQGQPEPHGLLMASRVTRGPAELSSQVRMEARV